LPPSYAHGVANFACHALRESVEAKDKDGKPKFLTKWGVDTNPAEIIANGMYQIESYSTNERVVFRRNPNYWRKDAQGQQQPYIERLIWQIVESTDTSLLQFRSGGLDTLGVLQTTSRYSSAREKETTSRFTWRPATGTTFISFNLTKGSEMETLVDPI
jgi:peptide/nickel transport system substrate-binding protein